MTRRALKHTPGQPMPVSTTAVRNVITGFGIACLQMGHPRVREQEGVKLYQSGTAVSVKVDITDPVERSSVMTLAVAALIDVVEGKKWELRVGASDRFTVQSTKLVPLPE